MRIVFGALSCCLRETSLHVRTIFMIIALGSTRWDLKCMFGILRQVPHKRENVIYRYWIFVIPFKVNLHISSHKQLTIHAVCQNNKHKCRCSWRLNWVSYINNRCFEKLMIVIFLSVLKLNITFCQVWIMC